MSLKAYDGLMTTKDMRYVQDETIKRLDRFRALSAEKLFEEYADMVINFVDKNHTPEDIIKWSGFSSDAFTKEKANKIKVTDDLSLLSLIYQLSKIHSESYFLNGFTVHLNITLEITDKRILIYPKTIVHKHRGIMLEYLDDWYAQNQCDSPDDVPEEEWEERCRNWYDFSEVQGFKLKMTLFDPHNPIESLNTQLRGDELIDGILSKKFHRTKNVRRRSHTTI